MWMGRGDRTKSSRRRRTICARLAADPGACPGQTGGNTGAACATERRKSGQARRALQHG
jgi:hypothetical protein